MLRKLLSVLSTQDTEERKAVIHRNILRDLAKMGGEVFGDIPAGTRREFFCLDRHTWVWHEEWTDKDGARKIRTTRYDSRPLRKNCPTGKRMGRRRLSSAPRCGHNRPF
jgi:hypothetical protein